MTLLVVAFIASAVSGLIWMAWAIHHAPTLPPGHPEFERDGVDRRSQYRGGRWVA